jgi:anionic cell wall polymer biosynthesis LytR-Cps2A-Psr (LCP) family protein
MKRGIWIAIAVGIVLILVGVVVILMFVPLGPAITALNLASTPTKTNVAQVSGLPATPTAQVAEATVTSSKSHCGSGSMNFLVLGESQPPRGTDAIRLVRVDFEQKRIDVLALPSELWVNTPGLSGSGIGGATLNELYLHGKTLASGDDRARMLAAVDLFAGTLQADFGFTPDHYFVLKEPPFTEYVDTLGGLDVVLPVAVDGRSQNMGYFPAGAIHLTGASALNLVRTNMSGEWARFDNQWVVIQAIYQSLLMPKNWEQLPVLVQDFHDDILTDLSVNQILQASCILKQPGVVVNQQVVGLDLLTFSGKTMLPRPELGQYILKTVGK